MCCDCLIVNVVSTLSLFQHRPLLCPSAFTVTILVLLHISGEFGTPRSQAIESFDALMLQYESLESEVFARPMSVAALVSMSRFLFSPHAHGFFPALPRPKDLPGDRSLC